uniref:LOW QUALITY PROTEIN: selenocysteine insertion sequence-binding protein 2-like n=1 Tax=Saccoglossus kowalevskii TaxID=10224 RepID=A0ABM0MC60_SACKO|nr:PREDICTED: LOW QUALITY PROTEIN: selenocysteine insertion sequence-binding protein 2-like [Saccoglossus kowalevskii]
MSHGGEKSPQAKTLSAEVEPFVPNRLGDGTTGDKSLPQQHYSDSSLPSALNNASKDQNSNVNIGELPSYMINCYPFVQDSCITDVRWQQGAQHHYPHQPYGNPHSEFYPQQQPPLPYPGYYPGYPINPYVTGYQPHQLPPPYPQGYPHKGGYRSNRQGGNKQNKNNRRRNKGGSADTKSVGVQKTSSGEKVIIPSKDIKRKIKTVIYVDACQQTDFPDDLANLSLLERPSSFRKAKAKNRRKTQSQQTRRTNISSTDSEFEEAQVDSDSGYSSPKHCRNLSVGSSTQGIVTQDAATGTPSSNTPASNTRVPSTSNVNTTTPSNTQATMASMAGPPVMSYAGAVAKAKVPVASVVTPSAIDRTHVAQQAMKTQWNKSKVINSTNRNLQSEPHDRKEVPADTINSTVSGTTATELVAQPIKKKKRQRKRNKSRDSGRSANSSINSLARSDLLTTPVPSAEEFGALKFEDDTEYQDLPSVVPNRSEDRPTVMSYSAVVQQRTTTPTTMTVHGSYVDKSDNYEDTEVKMKMLPEELMSPEVAVSTVKEGKNARKRRKKALIATQAAAQEYSEITEEQKQLQENLKKPNKRTKMPIEFDLGDMLAALEKKQQQEMKQKQKLVISAGVSPVMTRVKDTLPSGAGARPKNKDTPITNPLDSSAPVKRGKEREQPAKKKPSALKRVILREREEKKRLRILGECTLSDDDTNKVMFQEVDEEIEQGVQLSQESSEWTTGQVGPDEITVPCGNSDKGSSISLSQSQSELSPVSQLSPMSMSPLSPGSPLSSGLPSPVVFSYTVPNAALPKIHSRRFREYCNQMLDKEVDGCCTTLLQTLCRFQDKQYHKDPTRAKSRRRIVMGLREVTKHLRLRKVKCLLISPNLERIQSKGGLDEALDVIISLAQEQDVPFIFALGRKALGRAVNKLVPVSVVGIFNYDGAENTFRELLDLSAKARAVYNDMVVTYQQEIESQNAARIAKHRQHMGHNRNLSGCSGISFSSVISEPISENYPDPEPEFDEFGREIEQGNAYSQDHGNITSTRLERTDEEVEKTITTEVLNSYDNDGDVNVECLRTRSRSSSQNVKEDGEGDDDVDDDDEEEEEEEEEEEDDDDLSEEDDNCEITLENDKVCDSSFPVDKDRIECWVAEAQSCISSLKIEDIENVPCHEAAGNSHPPDIPENVRPGSSSQEVDTSEKNCHSDSRYEPNSS